jgi:formyltetrahydrofolate synthetase
MYGADGVDISADARRQIEQYVDGGLGNVPVCFA